MRPVILGTARGAGAPPLRQGRWGCSLPCRILVRRHLLHWLAAVSIAVTLAPEAIILGGGVSTAGEQLFAPLRRQLEARVKIVPFGEMRLLQAALGGDSGIHGALILGRRASTKKGISH